jgi:hypothetical protein
MCQYCSTDLYYAWTRILSLRSIRRLNITSSILVLYGCETRSLTLRKGYSLAIFQNMVLREILGLRGLVWEENGENCMMRSFMTCALHVNGITRSRTRWAGNVACTGENRHVYRVLVGKPEGIRTPVRSRRRRKDNIKMWGISWLAVARPCRCLWSL